MNATLLLNATYEPITVISWRKAVTLLVLEKVEALATYSTYIRSARDRIMHPAVVRLLSRVPWHKPRVRFSRKNVFGRDAHVCQYCGVKHPPGRLTLDHVKPRSQGGPTDWTNIVTSCQACNQRKANRTPSQARMALIRKPYTPYWLLPGKGQGEFTRPESWAPYMW